MKKMTEHEDQKDERAHGYLCIFIIVLTFTRSLAFSFRFGEQRMAGSDMAVFTVSVAGYFRYFTSFLKSNISISNTFDSQFFSAFR